MWRLDGDGTLDPELVMQKAGFGAFTITLHLAYFPRMSPADRHAILDIYHSSRAVTYTIRGK